MVNLLIDSSKRNSRSRLTNQVGDSRHPPIHQSNYANPNRVVIQNPNWNPNSGQNSISKSDSVQENFFSRPIPKRRRSGRPRIPALPSNLVRNFPCLLDTSRSSCANVGLSTEPSRSGRKKKSQTKTYSNSNSKKRSSSANRGNLTKKSFYDVSDEIIVTNEESIGEALIALTAGFPSNALIDEEIKAGVVPVMNRIELANYILIRNHIISRWRKNVSNWVTKEMFVDIIPKHCWPLLDSAYNYLVSYGYINFGVAPGIKDWILVEQSKPNVIVVGAGLAGLAAARQLLSFGFKVTVLEGRQRAGGRVHTMELRGKDMAAYADMGGSVLTGMSGNPLGILAQQLSLTLHKVRDKCPLYTVDGKPVDCDLDQKLEGSFNRILEKISNIRQSMGYISQNVSLGSALNAYRNNFNKEEINLFDWHIANLEYANGSLVSKLSLAFWDQDDPYEMGGDHCFLHGGNGGLVQALMENVPIIYGRPVKAICYGNDRVHVHVENGFYEGDMVLCTVPLGVLKRGLIKFIPNLPQRKLDSIQRLGFGLLNKVVMLFSHAFWGTDLDTFGRLSDNPSSRGEFFLFYNYATVAGGPILVALVAGEAAHKFETVHDSDSVTRVLQILKGIYEPQGIEVPEPIQSVCTKWGSDIFSLGSYSNVAVGASGEDYDILSESVGDGRLFFAGEATSRRYPASMHGALLSGFREAANMDHHARVRASRLQVEKDPSQNGHGCTCVLEYLFRTPEVEAGSFAVLFGRKNFDSKAILRVTFGEQLKKSVQQHSNKLLFKQLQSHFNQEQEFHIYTLISKQQALVLREVKGDDGSRLDYLCGKLGVKLVGEKSLGTCADSVIDSIMDERISRKPSTSGKSKSKAAFLKWKLIGNTEIVGNNYRSSDPRAKLSGKAIAMVLMANIKPWAIVMAGLLGSYIKARFSNNDDLAPPNSNSDAEFVNDTNGIIPHDNGSTTPYESVTGSTALSSDNRLLQIQYMAWRWWVTQMILILRISAMVVASLVQAQRRESIKH